MSSRGSFSRSVARAAASGGGRAYRARRPGGWYIILSAIVVAGLVLIVYSRNERIHPASASSTNNLPNGTSNWHLALQFDVCGILQSALPANTNLSSTGIRTFGDGLIDVDPGAVSSPKNFEGAKATLANFVANYKGLTLTSSELEVPGTAKLFKNGDQCTKAEGPSVGPGKVEIMTWSSTTAKGKLLASANPADVRLHNGEMIMVAFVHPGFALPEPESKGALINTLNGKASTSPSTTPTTVAAATGTSGSKAAVASSTSTSTVATTSTKPAGAATGATGTKTP